MTSVRRLFAALRKRLRWARPLAGEVRRFHERARREQSTLEVAERPRVPEPVYQDACTGRASLRHLHGLPVLQVAGSPDEMGQQIGSLILARSPQVHRYLEFERELMAHHPILQRVSQRMIAAFPEHHRRELEAASRSAKVEWELLVFANVIDDIVKRCACSALLVEPDRSASGEMLMGRNLDFLPQGCSPDFGLIVVYKPAGKRAFVSITYPALIGCMTGMNDAGLVVAGNEVYGASDRSVKFDRRGVSMPLVLRLILEQCATVDEAGELLRSVRRTKRISVAVCDARGGKFFEVTPSTVAERMPVNGVAAGTNHFRCPGLATRLDFPDYDTLQQTSALPVIGTDAIQTKLHAVNQGTRTVQSMIFEPLRQRIHLAIGIGPVTAQPLRTLDLAPLFARRDMRSSAIGESRRLAGSLPALQRS